MKLLELLTDKDASPTLMLRSWHILIGVAMLAFSSVWFSPIEQGFYFSFLSIAALQVFFELGLNYVATQIVAHEAAHSYNRAPNLEGGDPHLNLIAEVCKFLKIWYAFAAPAFFCLVTLAGYFLFSNHIGINTSEWFLPWLLLVLFTSINLYFSPVFAVAEGMGDVGPVARFRLKQSMAGYALMCIGLSMGWGLWAAWLVQGTAAVWTFSLISRNKTFTRHFRKPPSPSTLGMQFDWKADLLPMQWRIALSWASGYLLFPILTPITMLNLGPIEAGKVGLAIAGFNAVIALGMGWINAKGPAIAMLIARKDVVGAKKLYVKSSIISTSLVALGSLAILAIALLAELTIFQGRVRLPEVAVILALTVNSLANSIVFAAAVFMRAHKVEPMVAISVVGGVISVVSFYIGSLYSITNAIVIYTAVTTLVILPWTIVILRRFTTKTHG
jgi:hypothetical protein